VFTAALVFLIITDFMFLNDSSFVYDPDYRSWQVKTGTDYASSW
jgi:hypothetical protein